MTLPRRKFLYLAGGAAAALPALPRIARAQAYPARPVRIVVGAPPGGSSDITARLIGQSLSERLSQPVIIENRASSGANIAAEASCAHLGWTYATSGQYGQFDQRDA